LKNLRFSTAKNERSENDDDVFWLTTVDGCAPRAAQALTFRLKEFLSQMMNGPFSFAKLNFLFVRSVECQFTDEKYFLPAQGIILHVPGLLDIHFCRLWLLCLLL
jgi:hypothetical protein